jgi:hypothetical protein
LENTWDVGLGEFSLQLTFAKGIFLKPNTYALKLDTLRDDEVVKASGVDKGIFTFEDFETVFNKGKEDNIVVVKESERFIPSIKDLSVELKKISFRLEMGTKFNARVKVYGEEGS